MPPPAGRGVRGRRVAAGEQRQRDAAVDGHRDPGRLLDGDVDAEALIVVVNRAGDAIELQLAITAARHGERAEHVRLLGGAGDARDAVQQPGELGVLLPGQLLDRQQVEAADRHLQAGYGGRPQRQRADRLDDLAGAVVEVHVADAHLVRQAA